MTTPEFVRQENDALYPQILYNRPVTRSGAGRLLVPGGHTGELSQPTALFELAMAVGAGEVVMALPDVLVKLLGGVPSTTFVASSPSGSLGTEALGRLLELSEDADGVALGVSLSNNSHTAILLERFLREVRRPVIAFDDAINLMLPNPEALLTRADTLLVVTMPQVFKLADKLGVPITIRPGGGLINKLEIIAAVSARLAPTLWVYGTEVIIASGSEPPIVTPADYRLSTFPTVYYALASVFWIQNRTRHREGLATAAFIAGRVSRHVRTDGRPTVSALATLIRTELEAGADF